MKRPRDAGTVLARGASLRLVADVERHHQKEVIVLMTQLRALVASLILAGIVIMAAGLDAWWPG